MTRSLLKYFFIPVVILAALYLRLSRPDLMLFNRDEGALFLLVEDSFQSSKWSSHGLEGTKGFFYGPVPVSIYSGLRQFVSHGWDLIETAFYFNGFIQILSLLPVLFLTRHLFSRWSWLLVCGLMLTSPHLLFYSRKVWDNPFLICWGNICLAYVLWMFQSGTRDQESTSKASLIPSHHALLLGVFVGLMIGTHLMSLPLVGAITLVVLFGGLKAKTNIDHRFWLRVFAFVAAIGLVTGSYLLDVLQTRSIASTEAVGESFRVFYPLTATRDILIKWTSWMSWGEFAKSMSMGRVELLFERLWAGASWHLLVVKAMALVSMVLGIVSAIYVILFAVKVFRRFKSVKSDAFTMLKVFFAFLIVMQMGMMLVMDATNQPHYFQAVWWLPFLVIGFSIDECKQGYENHSLRALAGMTIAVNLVFNGLLHKLYERDGGVTLLHFGATYSEQTRAVSDLCVSQHAGLAGSVIDDPMVIGESSLRWQLRMNPTCQGLDQTNLIGPPVKPSFEGKSARIIWAKIDH